MNGWVLTFALTALGLYLIAAAFAIAGHGWLLPWLVAYFFNGIAGLCWRNR